MRVILIILLIYFGIKILSRLFTPLLIKFVANKAEKQFGQQFNQYNNRQEQTKKEGEVSIDKMPNSKSSNKTVGEYVDYEEID